LATRNLPSLSSNPYPSWRRAGAGDFPGPPPVEDEVSEEEWLRREFTALGEVIYSNASFARVADVR
jgi:hypothetical protein